MVWEEKNNQTEKEWEENNMQEAWEKEINDEDGAAGADQGEKEASSREGGPEATAGNQVAAEEELEELRRRLEEAEAKRDEYLRLAQRLQADFENFKRRAERQRFETVQKANEDLILKLLPLLDDLERALNTVEQEADPQTIVEGVRLIYKQFLEVLAKEGVEPVSAEGEMFDPQKHEAVMRENCLEQPEGTVLEEYRRGYCMRDRVIRPCMVKVAVAPEESGSEEVGEKGAESGAEEPGEPG